jgi:hypothetical protein
VQLQAELRQPHAKTGKEPPHILFVLEADDEIVSEPYDDHLAVDVVAPPPLHEQVQHVVQVHIGEWKGGLLSGLTLAELVTDR